MSTALAPHAPPDGIEVLAAPHPFSTKRIRILVGELATLEEIVTQAGLPPGCHARVFIERAGLTYGPIGREWWPRIRPKRGSRVTIRAVPYGGGGKGDSNKVTRLILQIVIWIVVAVLTYLVPALTWLWVIGGAAVMAAINFLLPPQQPKLPGLANLAGAIGRPAESPTFSITGSQNKANPFGPIPRVFGRHRLFPPGTEEP